MNKEKGNNGLVFDYAFILTILTGLSYFLSYLFYVGKLFFYNLPISFIELGINNIVYSFLHLAPLIILCSWHAFILLRRTNQLKEESNSAATFLSRKNKPTQKRLKKFFANTIFITLTILSILLIYLINKDMIWAYLVGYITSILLPFTIRLYKEKFYVYLMILVFIYSSVLSFGIGYYRSLAEEKYIIIEENDRTFVALSVYKEQFILAPFNQKTKKFTNEYKLVEIKELKKFKRLDTGRIEMKINK